MVQAGRDEVPGDQDDAGECSLVICGSWLSEDASDEKQALLIDPSEQNAFDAW